jgi:endonuclease/exonuclease/phosphatase family metal-dependent hydrolase
VRALAFSVLVVVALGCSSRDGAEVVPAAPPAPPVPGGSAPAPVIDGVFDEWGDEHLRASDALGDASGAFDVTRLYAQSRGSRLFLHFDTSHLLNLVAGPDADGTLVLQVRLPDGRLIEVDARARMAFVDGVPQHLHGLGFVSAPTHAGNAFELRIDLGPLGVGVGSTVALSLAGSDALEPVPFTFSDVASAALPLDMTRTEASAFRLASLNTEQSGLTHPARGAAIGRLLAAVVPDVIVLQELGQTPPDAIAAALAKADPRHDGASWNVHAVGAGTILGNAVASPSPIVPMTTPSSRFAAAVVLLPDPGPVVIYSVHLKCCGYLASDEDLARLAQAHDLVDAIAALRAGALGRELSAFRDAPVIVVGDFNDVGSPQLETSMLTSPGPSLLRWPLRHLAGSNVHTWRSTGGAFPPAILDLLFADPTLVRDNGFVFDSADLDDEQHDALALLSGDSGASDHLMLVADFSAARR